MCRPLFTLHQLVADTTDCGAAGWRALKHRDTTKPINVPGTV